MNPTPTKRHPLSDAHPSAQVAHSKVRRGLDRLTASAIWSGIIAIATVSSVIAEQVTSGSADSSTGLEITARAERRVSVASNADGSTASKNGQQFAYVEASQLAIGDEVTYTLRVRNTLSTPVDNPVVVRALPLNTKYVDRSASGPAVVVTYSVDGGQTFALSDELQITLFGGKTRRAEARDYTHIRWQMRHALAPGATAILRFRGTFQ